MSKKSVEKKNDGMEIDLIKNEIQDNPKSHEVKGTCHAFREKTSELPFSFDLLGI